MQNPSPGGAARDVFGPRQTKSSCEENSSTPTAFFRIMGLWLDRRRRRQALEDLAERKDHLLADVGLTREEALREAGKPFWRA
jgi:uncharacterized protein YjiS (DUF1127 family)